MGVDHGVHHVVRYSMAMIPVDSIDDPRLDAYRNLKDRTLASMGDLFLAESEHVVRRMLETQSQLAVSVLVAENRAHAIAPLMPPDVPLYVGSKTMLSDIVGFAFHAGVLAIGRRPANPTLASLFTDDAAPVTLLVCQQVLNDENLGSLIRIAAGFGAGAVILGERSCDPWWRRAIRVSMGTVFSMPIIRSDNLLNDLLTLEQAWGVELIATVLDDDATPLPDSLRDAMPNRGRRLAILVGSESQGLDRKMIEHCHRKVTIPMHLGTDSLNIAMASAVFLYHYTSQRLLPSPANCTSTDR